MRYSYLLCMKGRGRGGGTHAHFELFWLSVIWLDVTCLRFQRQPNFIFVRHHRENSLSDRDCLKMTGGRRGGGVQCSYHEFVSPLSPFNSAHRNDRRTK